MNSNDDGRKRFEVETKQRIKYGDYHAVFRYGCCYHFALKVNEMYGHRLRLIRSINGGVAHCWAKKDEGRAVDINGVLPEKVTIAIYDSDNRNRIEDITPDELRMEMEKKGMSKALTRTVFNLAERIIKTHMRFEDARPTSNVFE